MSAAKREVLLWATLKVISELKDDTAGLCAARLARETLDKIEPSIEANRKRRRARVAISHVEGIA